MSKIIVNKIEYASSGPHSDEIINVMQGMNNLTVDTGGSATENSIITAIRNRVIELGINSFWGTVSIQNTGTVWTVGVSFIPDYSKGVILRFAYAGNSIMKYRYNNDTWNTDVYLNANNFASVETSSTSSSAYNVNDYLVYNGQLYRVSSAIASGGTISPGTNVISTDIGTQLNAIGTTTTNSINTAVSVATGTWTLIGTLSVPDTGKYIVDFGLRYVESSSTQYTGTRIAIFDTSNSNPSSIIQRAQMPASSGNTYCSRTTVTGIPGGSTIYLKAYQNSGSAINVTGVIRITRLS